MQYVGQCARNLCFPAGLKSKCISYKTATYMILSQLAVQTKLKEDLLDALLPILTKVRVLRSTKRKSKF